MLDNHTHVDALIVEDLIFQTQIAPDILMIEKYLAEAIVVGGMTRVASHESGEGRHLILMR